MDELDFEEIMRMQRMMASEIVREQQTDNKIKLMDIINDMSSGRKKILQKEAVILEGQMEGLTEHQVEVLIEELKKDNFIVEKEGFLKKI